MALNSPGVVARERDLTATARPIVSTAAAYVGAFGWGPIESPQRIENEPRLVEVFGQPAVNGTVDFLTAASYLAYSGNLLVNRVDAENLLNSVTTRYYEVGTARIVNAGSNYSGTPTVEVSAPDLAPAEGGVQAEVSFTVTGGEFTDFQVTVPGFGYETAPTVTVTDLDGTDAVLELSLAPAQGMKIKNQDQYDTTYRYENEDYIDFAAKYAGSLGNSLRISIADSNTYDGWEFENLFPSAPATSESVSAMGGSNDELHIVIVDELGLFSGNAGSVLESFGYVSKARGAKTTQGANNFFRDVLADRSNYVLPLSNVQADWGSEPATAFTQLTEVYNITFQGGSDDWAVDDADRQNAWEEFADESRYDFAFAITGPVSAVTAAYVIQNVCEVRQDCVATASPIDALNNTPIIGRGSAAEEAVLEWRNSMPSTSYGFFDSGYKYMYDRYNDVYRWVPLNADTAGCMARNDLNNDPWISPAGVVKGQIKNSVKLAFNPTKANRDALYPKGINAVISEPGNGTFLYGDKTGLTRPSAFDRINVRRLFIVLRETISEAAKTQLFEINDSFTRAQFRNLVEPFLRDVQGRRGVYDFRVVCDETNNTGQVIDNNEFRADIYVKPSRSINFITLTFVAARSDVDFSEVE